LVLKSSRPIVHNHCVDHVLFLWVSSFFSVLPDKWQESALKSGSRPLSLGSQFIIQTSSYHSAERNITGRYLSTPYIWIFIHYTNYN
jgi:hypothetical protein